MGRRGWGLKLALRNLNYRSRLPACQKRIVHGFPKLERDVTNWEEDQHKKKKKKKKTNKLRTKKNSERGLALKRSAEKDVGFQPVLLTRNLAFFPGAVPNYKHMFGLHRDPLPHQ